MGEAHGFYMFVFCKWLVIFFFFSSRRRHTRLQGDWSSDVCTSDLSVIILSASTSLPDRIITDHTDITNNTVHRQPSYNISTGGDNSNLCSNGSSTAASAGISAFWYLVVLSAGLVFFICGWYWNI